MILHDLLLRFGLSFGIGAVIGLEREYSHDEESTPKERNTSMGIRTYSLISFLGGLSGYLAATGNPLALFAAGITGAIILAYYILSSLRTQDHGPTSEIGAVAAFFLGTLLFVSGFPVSLVLAAAVVVTFFLSRKKEIKNIAYNLHQFETNAFFMYGIIALVILPFLPDTWIHIGDMTLLTQIVTAYGGNLRPLASVELINPYKLWMVVTLITGIDLLGYMLQKVFGGQKGWLLAALTGGFVSSTATTLALAQRSKKSTATGALVTAAILANTASFVQMLILVLPLNSVFFTHSSLFFAALLGSSVIVSLVTNMQRRGRENAANIQSSSSVFSLKSALTFAVMFSIIRAGSQAARLILGESGVILTSAVGAIAGMDAVIITIADLAGKSLSLGAGLTALIAANTVNLATKIFYAKTSGSPAFFRSFTLAIAGIILISAMTLFVQP